MVSVSAAKIDITPEGPCELSGFALREQPSQGVHDPVFVRAVVLASDGLAVALVSCDLLGLDPPDAEEVRRRLAEELGIGGAMVSCTHTHGAPAVMALKGCGTPDPQYVAAVKGAIVECVRAAGRGRDQCWAKMGVGAAGVAMNRRATVDGRTHLLTSTSQQARATAQGPVDPAVPTIQLGGDDGPVVMLFGHACHGTSVGHENRLITADHPGAACAHVEGRGDAGLPIFVQGACGDVNPAVETRGFEAAARVGRAEAEAAMASLAAGVAVPLRSLAYAERGLQLPLMGTGDLVPVVISAIAADDFAVVSLPGEAFVGLGMAVRSASPFAVTMVAGYANGNVGYIPTRSAYPLGGYEVDSAYQYYGYPAPLAPEAGEMAVAAALECLNDCKEQQV